MKWIKKAIRTKFNKNKDTFIKNIPEGAELILNHIKKKSRIFCFTDYDVDGIGCAYILNWFFKKIRYNVVIKIPDRSEGYGLSKKWIEENKDNVDLIITADNGISKNEEIELAKSFGIDVLVTDHHLPSNTLPDCIVVDPKIESSDFTKELCGAGVVFYLLRETIKKMNIDININEVLDMLTLSTISDLVELDQANRQIVIAGLKRINDRKFSSKGLEMLFDKFTQEIKSADIAFGVAPIINAVGRIGNPNMVFDFITDKDLSVFEEIVDMNERRKDIQHMFAEKALLEVNNDKKIIIYKNDKIPKGLVGLIAGEISNKLYKPTIVIANNHGSGRSIDDVNLHELVFCNSNKYIKHGGGHAQALGLSISDFDKFKEILEKHAETTISENQLKQRKYYWKKIKNNELFKTYNYLDQLEPFGMGNEKPNIVLENMIIKDYRIVGKNKNVLQFSSVCGVRFIVFKYIEDNPLIKVGSKINVLGKISKNVFNGNTSYQVLVENMVKSQVLDG